MTIPEPRGKKSLCYDKQQVLEGQLFNDENIMGKMDKYMYRYMTSSSHILMDKF